MANRYSNFDTPNYSNFDNKGSTLAAFSIGLGVGAGLALLFAPKRGEEIRNDIANRANDLADRARDQFDSVRNQARDQFDNVRNKVGSTRTGTDPNVRTGSGI